MDDRETVEQARNRSALWVKDDGKKRTRWVDTIVRSVGSWPYCDHVP